MQAARIQARAVAKVTAVAIGVLAATVLLAFVLVEVRTTLRWFLAAGFLALALAPAVSAVQGLRLRGRSLPRWLAILAVYAVALVVFGFLVLHVIPPIVREFEALGSKLPAYVRDFEHWADGNSQFRELNDRYDLTKLLAEGASSLPARLGDAAGEAKSVTVGLLANLVEAVIVLAMAFFLLLDGGRSYVRLTSRLPGGGAESARRIGERTAAIVKSYVTVNLALAAAAGVFTWLALELLGVELAVPLAVLVALLDLVPLIGFTVGGLLVALVAAFHSFPGALIAWLALFLAYQQLQDRVVQPLLYRNAVRVQPVLGIVVVLAGAQLAGILGALLAIPVAAVAGVVAKELLAAPAAGGEALEPAVATAPAPGS